MRRVRSSAAAALVLALAAAASAYVENLVAGPTGLMTIARPAGATVTYLLNDQILLGPPNVEAGSAPVAAIDAAHQAIAAAAGLTYVNGGTTAVASAGADGINLVTFAATAQNAALVGGAIAADVFFVNLATGAITETDMIFNPALSFSTLGTAGFNDVQSVATHEAGHGAGLAHSMLWDATMQPFHPAGTAEQRTLQRDDRAGLGALYPAAASPLSGSVTGMVQRAPGQPVGGAHLVLEDAITGRAVAGQVSRADGSFTIAGVPAGVYRLWAEPLDGPFTPANLSAGWSTIAFDTTFRSAVLGGAAAPTLLTVRPGVATPAPLFTVAGPASTKNITGVFLVSGPGGAISVVNGRSQPVTPPYGLFFGAFGPGVNTLPDAAFSFGSPFVAIAGPSTASGMAGAAGFKIFPLTVLAAAPPGGYLLRALDPATGESTIAPGALEVLSPAAPLAYATAFGAPCPAGPGALALAAASPPALGNFAFALTLSNVLPGEQAFLFVSAFPAAVPIGGACAVHVDLAALLPPLDGLLLPVAGSTAMLPLPLPPLPALAGFEAFAQGATFNFATGALRLSNGLALHLE